MALTRHKEYEYQYKSISAGNGAIGQSVNAISCGYGATMNFNLPQNFIEIKNIFVHIIIEFEAAEPVANRKITRVGSPLWPPDGAQPHMLDVDFTADPTTRVIDMKVDLTQIKDQLLIIQPGLYEQGNIPIGIKHPGALSGFAIIKLWKMELVYTTEGIR